MKKRILCLCMAGIVIASTLLATTNFLNLHKAYLISDVSILEKTNVFKCGEIVNFTSDMSFSYRNYNYVRLINRMTDSNADLLLRNKTVDNSTINTMKNICNSNLSLTPTDQQIQYNNILTSRDPLTFGNQVKPSAYSPIKHNITEKLFVYSVQLMEVMVATLFFSFIIFILIVIRKSAQKHSVKIDEIYLKLKDDLKHSITPSFIEISPDSNNLIELAIEIWKIEKKITHLLSLVPDNHHPSLINSVGKLKRHLEKYEIKVIDYTNQKFNDGLNLDVLDVLKDASQPFPVVKETIEPTIMCKGHIVRKAKIILISN